MRKFFYGVIIIGVCIFGIMTLGQYMILGLIFTLGIRFVLHLISQSFKIKQ